MKRDAEQRRMEQIEIEEWRRSYFAGIKFPIMLLRNDSYWSISDLYEYFIDEDINVRFAEPGCRLVTANGDVFSLKKIENNKWVPCQKAGSISPEELMIAVTPLLFMPDHPDKVKRACSVMEIIQHLVH